MTAEPACTCEACEALATYYGADPALLAFYQRRLLVRGWAGLKIPEEKAYILAHAPFAQAAAQAGAANLTWKRFSGVDSPRTDATDTEMVAEDLHAAELAPIGAV